MKKVFVIIFALISLSLSACAGFRTQLPAPAYFLLHPVSVLPEEQKSLPFTMIVETPEIVSGLNTDKIALFKNNRRELDFYAEAKWNGRLDDILQEFIIETIENSYKDVEVDSSGTHLKAGYKILTKVRDFQAEYNGQSGGVPLLRINIAISAVKLPKEESLARVQIEKKSYASANTLIAVTTGLERLMQQALDAAFKDLVGQL